MIIIGSQRSSVYECLLILTKVYNIKYNLYNFIPLVHLILITASNPIFLVRYRFRSILKQGSKWRKHRAAWVLLISAPRERQLSSSSGRIELQGSRSSLVTHPTFTVTFLTRSHRIRTVLLLPPQTLKIWHQSNPPVCSSHSPKPWSALPRA